MLISACGSLPSKVEPADQDNDNVADINDACLQTAPGSPVDSKGCSLFRGVIESVDFAAGSVQLNSTSRESLAKLVERLNAYPNVALKLEGHTDNRGAASKNLELSKQRVMAVTRYLVSKGIEGNRLKPIGLGENRPLASNATPEGRKRNRRIEMSVFTP